MRVLASLLLASIHLCDGLRSGLAPRAAPARAACGRRDWVGAVSVGAGAALLRAPAARADENDRKLGKRPSAEKAIVNINKSAGPDYMVLPGMYPTIASKIVDRVRRQGPFKSLKELYEMEDIKDNARAIAIIKKYEKSLVLK